MKTKKTLTILSCFAALSFLSSCASGAQGEKGEKGDSGDQGIQGEKGSDGKDGTSILTGEGTPSKASGKEGDLYLDTSTGDIYVKGPNGWSQSGNIKGEDGKNGTSIKGTKIDENGDLIVVYDDGTERKVDSIAKHTVNFYWSEGDEEPLSSVQVEHGKRLNEPTDISVPGYSIKGWNSKEDGGYRWLFSAYPVLGDIDLYADYETEKYTVTIVDEQFGMGSKQMSVSYLGEYDFSSLYSKPGYVCTFKNGEEAFPSKGTYSLTESITLACVWSDMGLNLESEDESKGKAEITNVAKTTTGATFTIEAAAESGYVFDGWYKGEEWVAHWNPYSYSSTLESEETLTAHFISEEEYAERYASIPEIDAANKTVKFGYYPQKRISDKDLISKLEKLGENGNGFRCYKGEYYTKVDSANPAEPYTPASDEAEEQEGYRFEDGERIIKGETYWFECEKIVWRILSTGENSYSLVSEKTLNGSFYDADSNNYKESDIRHWLGDGFLNSAFAFSTLSYLEETPVDNSLASTLDSSNPYTCSETSDPVYLPSFKELSDEALYPASLKTSRVTDYARALGVNCSDNADSFNAIYWTRSPDASSSKAVKVIDWEGNSDSYSVNQSSFFLGVRPAITIKVS